MKQFIKELLLRNDYQSVRLLTILREIQTEFRFISKETIEILADELNIERTQIISVVEFYSFFHLQPRGQYDILLSDSITDHMLGKQHLMDYLSKQLNVAVGETREECLVSLDNTSCSRMCDQGPAALINGLAIPRLDKQKIDEIVDLITQQIPIFDWPENLFTVSDNIHKPNLLLETEIQHGEALEAAFSHDLKHTLQEIDLSGLRGRGGAGFSTAMKWKFCAEENDSERYVVCNADEGEPGTFKDRVLLNSYAHQVFEGMTVCAAIIGSEQGFLYLRGEYLHLYPQLQHTLQHRRELRLLGKNILQKKFNFDIEIRLGAGAYICGEESALIESLEGKRGIPRNRPPTLFLKAI